MNVDQTPSTVTMPAASKKAYRSPEFVIYGDVRYMTQNVGPRGQLDNGGGGAAGPKTSA